MMKYKLLLILLLASIGLSAQTAWTSVGNGLQQRVVSGKTEYRFIKTSPYTPFGVTDSLNLYQKLLISGTNIKTVGGASILGSGDIPVTPASGGPNYIQNQTATAQTADYKIGGNGTQKTLTITPDGTSTGTQVSFAFASTADQFNSGASALYISPTVSGLFPRVFFGTSANKIGEMNFTNVGGVSGFPAFQTVDNMGWGFSLTSHMIGRTGTAVRYHASGDANADHIFTGNAAGFGNYTTGLELLRLKPSGQILVPGQIQISTLPTLGTHALRLQDSTQYRTASNSYSLSGMQTKLNGYMNLTTAQNVSGLKTYNNLGTFNAGINIVGGSFSTRDFTQYTANGREAITMPVANNDGIINLKSYSTTGATPVFISTLKPNPTATATNTYPATTGTLINDVALNSALSGYAPANSETLQSVSLRGNTSTRTLVSSAAEGFKIISTDGFISFWNTDNSLRNGFIQGSDGRINISSEQGSKQVIINEFGGNLGVKNGSPQEALDVTGKIRASVAPTNPTDVVRLTDLSAYVNTTTAQTVGGVKNFTSNLGVNVASPIDNIDVSNAIRVRGSSGAVAARSGVFDYFGTGARLTSYGADASTYGGFQLNGATSAGTTQLILSTNGQRVSVEGAPIDPKDVVRLTDLSGYVTTDNTAQTVSGNKSFVGNTVTIRSQNFNIDAGFQVRNPNLAGGKIMLNSDFTIGSTGSKDRGRLGFNSYDSVTGANNVVGYISAPIGNISGVALIYDLPNRPGTVSVASTQRFALSGNGSATSFSYPHGLTGVVATSAVALTANSAAASNFSYATVDATNVNIFYSVAPVSGTNNLIFTAVINPY